MSALMPRFSRYRRVRSGYSVDTRSPDAARSSTRWAGESLATASTSRMGRLLALE